MHFYHHNYTINCYCHNLLILDRKVSHFKHAKSCRCYICLYLLLWEAGANLEWVTQEATWSFTVDSCNILMTEIFYFYCDHLMTINFNDYVVWWWCSNHAFVCGLAHNPQNSNVCMASNFGFGDFAWFLWFAGFEVWSSVLCISHCQENFVTKVFVIAAKFLEKIWP